MTREKAINMLYGIQADNLNLDDAYTKDKYDALTMAIKALEQVSDLKYDNHLRKEHEKELQEKVKRYRKRLWTNRQKPIEQEPKTDVLDKIKAEIEEQAKINQNLNTDRARALCWCLDIIDKHRGKLK